jgi:hypothetical protein
MFRRPASLTRLLAALAIPVLLSGSPASSPAESPSTGIHEVEAAFLYRFLSFVEFPDDAEDAREPIVIGVHGDESVLDALAPARELSVRGRALVVRRCDDPADLSACHLVFLADGAKSRTQEALEAVRGRGVLTVGESESFLDLGGIIAFKVRSERIRFDVNLRAARREGLALSSQLLEVADEVLE